MRLLGEVLPQFAVARRAAAAGPCRTGDLAQRAGSAVFDGSHNHRFSHLQAAADNRIRGIFDRRRSNRLQQRRLKRMMLKVVKNNHGGRRTRLAGRQAGF